MDNTHSVLGSNPVIHSDGGWLLIAMLMFPEGEDEAASECWLVSILQVPKSLGALAK